MAQNIILKRSSLPGKVPDTGSLNIGEIAVNTYDGKLFIKRSGNLDSIEGIVTTNSITTGSISLTKTGSFAELVVTQDANIFRDLYVTNDIIGAGDIDISGNITGSSALLSGSLILSGSQTITNNLTVFGEVNARQFNISVISSSILFESGSSKFGNTLDDTHQFTGSVNVTGSLYLNGIAVATGSNVGNAGVFDFNLDPAAGTIGFITDSGSNYIVNATSTSVNIIGGETPFVIITSQSFSTNTTFTASLQQGYTLVGNSSGISYAVATSSIAGALPTGVISGSSQLTSSVLATTGSNTFVGNQIIVGAVSASAFTGSINYTNITNVPTLVSGSSQITYASISSIPADIVSGSSQIVGILGALNTFSASASSSLGDIQNYTSSLRTAFTISGANATFNGDVTIPGNLTVAGTTTQVNSTTIQLSDNIIELNGNGVVNGGLLVKDPTAPNTVSGSLLWDSTNDYWKAGAAGAESKLLRAEGDSIVSGSSQITFSGISSLPTLVSGSSQITLASTTGYGSVLNQAVLTSSSPSFGGVTLTGALTGTSASFSSNSGIIVGANSRAFIRQTIHGDAEIGAPLGGTLSLINNGSVSLSFISTGAATFSNSVTAAGTNYLSNTSTATATTYQRILNTGGDLILGLNNSAGNALATGGLAYATLMYNNTATAMQFGTNANVNMTILSGGNVGIGTASPAQLLDVRSANTSGATGATIRVGSQNHGASGDEFANLEFYSGDPDSEEVKTKIYAKNTGNVGPGGGGAADLLFATRPAFGSLSERMRITSGGYLKLREATISTSNVHILRADTLTDAVCQVTNANASQTSDGILTVVASRNTTNNTFFAYAYYNDGAGVFRFRVADSGNVTNTNNSYGGISDAKLKENIEDATPKLDDLMKVKIRNYNLIGDDKKQIGVIAQELEEVFPAMIDESEDFEEVEVPQLNEEGNEVLNEEGEVVTTKERVSKGTTTKSVKYSVFVPMLIKAIQELKTEIDSLKNQMQ